METQQSMDIQEQLLMIHIQLVTNIAIASTTTTTIAVNVGISSAGGLVAPLQMEFIASILENSTA